MRRGVSDFALSPVPTFRGSIRTTITIAAVAVLRAPAVTMSGTPALTRADAADVPFAASARNIASEMAVIAVELAAAAGVSRPGPVELEVAWLETAAVGVSCTPVVIEHAAADAAAADGDGTG